jgi:hypothetical protein
VKLFAFLTSWLLAARDDRGDVPGWVMVTVMTAILVVAILGIFEPQIKSALTGIIDSVSGSK